MRGGDVRKTCLALSALTVSVTLSATAHADSYDYEIGISYDAIRASTESDFAVPVGPLQPSSFELDSDNNALGLRGTWFFDGVAASSGPRSRAAFIGRASAISLSYTRAEGDTASTLNSSNPAIPPSSNRSESETKGFSASLRWVWAASGWYGLAGLSRADSETSGDSASVDFATDTYHLGVGKYLGSQTTLELSVVRLDSDVSGPVIGGNANSTEATVAFSHIEMLGRTWQYGTDIALATTERGASDGSYSVRLSIYPSRPLAFGFEVDGALQDPGGVSTNYGLFASWFPRERIGFDARYGWIDIDEPSDTDFDQYTFGLGVNFRF
jgi:hypothetical protein